jgi:hypothetical protein
MLMAISGIYITTKGYVHKNEVNSITQIAFDGFWYTTLTEDKW